MSEPRSDLPEMSVEEYLAFEEASEGKHEYVEGQVYAMSGVHSRHERILSNVLGHLWTAARGGPCRVYASSLKVRAPTVRFYYPDASTACAPRDDDGLILEDPCLLVEITSPSTKRTDHFEKRDAYLQIRSLRAYLIVEIQQREVTHCWRDPSGAWQQEVVVDQGAVAVSCPPLTLTLDEIYEGVTMPPPPKLRIREPEPAYEE